MENLSVDGLNKKLLENNLELLEKVLELNKRIVDLEIELYALKNKPVPTYPVYPVYPRENWWEIYPITTCGTTTVSSSFDNDSFISTYCSKKANTMQ